MRVNVNFLNPDEKLLFAKVLNQVYFCQKRHEKAFSDFLDPARIEQFTQIIRSEFNIKLHSFGGYENAERQMIGFFPDYLDEQDYQFPIEALEITYNKKFSKDLTHRDYLGSILGLGIDRSKVGDILLAESSTIFFVDQDISSYILMSLEKVANTKISVKRKDILEISELAKEEKQLNIIVSSLRMDSVVSAAFHISRAKSADLIRAEKVFVNWKPITNISKNISMGDIITLRGHGRAKINEVVSKTKKDRLVINIMLT